MNVSTSSIEEACAGLAAALADRDWFVAAGCGDGDLVVYATSVAPALRDVPAFWGGYTVRIERTRRPVLAGAPA